MTNNYEILGLDHQSTLEQIKSAYRQLSLKWHPDKLNHPDHLAKNREEAEEKFKEINKAYQILSDSNLRTMYDINGDDLFKENEQITEEFRKENRLQEKIKKVISNIISKFNTNWRVNEEDLDSSLWSPFGDWKEKIWNLQEIDELSSFQSQLINEIEEKSWVKRRELEEKARIEKIFLAKKESIEKIEFNLEKNNVRIEELSENNRNFRNSIENLSEEEVDWKIASIESKIKNNIEKIITERLQEFQKAKEGVIDLIKKNISSHSKITEKDLDESLWSGYSNWLERVQKFEDYESLYFFQEKLINSIKKESERKKNNLEMLKDEPENGLLKETNIKYSEETRKVNNENIYRGIEENRNANLIGKKSSRDDKDDLGSKERSHLKKEIIINDSILSFNWMEKCAQKRLEENCPIKEERSEIKKIIIDGLGLKNFLDLSDFINLEELCCSDNKINKLILRCNNKLKIIKCSKNQLNFLDLRNCFFLEELNCIGNQLTELFLPNTNHLKVINVENNYLSIFNYKSLNPYTLTHLNIVNNNLKSTDLDVFSNLINLEELLIGSLDDKKIFSQGGIIYNNFFGSLASLGNLTRLKSLDISNTNINKGLEYLPENLEEIKIASWWVGGKIFGCRAISYQLGNVQHNNYCPYSKVYNLSEWRKDNPNWAELIKTSRNFRDENEFLKMKLIDLEQIVNDCDKIKESLNIPEKFRSSSPYQDEVFENRDSSKEKEIAKSEQIIEKEFVASVESSANLINL